MTLYGPDLSYIHHVGYRALAAEAAPWLLGLLRQARIETGLIVDLACGSGVWPARATAAGFSVLGVDVSPAMIDLARHTAPDATFIVGSAHTVEIPSCVAVTALGEGISYLADETEPLALRGLLSRAAAALVPGGLLVFDVIERGLDRPMTYDASSEGADWSLRVEVREDPRRWLLRRTIRVARRVGGETRHSVETHSLRTFDPVEILRSLERLGFEATTTRAYGALALPPQRIGFVAYRPRE